MKLRHEELFPIDFLLYLGCGGRKKLRHCRANIDWWQHTLRAVLPGVIKGFCELSMGKKQQANKKAFEVENWSTANNILRLHSLATKFSQIFLNLSNEQLQELNPLAFVHKATMIRVMSLTAPCIDKKNISIRSTTLFYDEVHLNNCNWGPKWHRLLHIIIFLSGLV